MPGCGSAAATICNPDQRARSRSGGRRCRLVAEREQKGNVDLRWLRKTIVCPWLVSHYIWWVWGFCRFCV